MKEQIGGNNNPDQQYSGIGTKSEKQLFTTLSQSKEHDFSHTPLYHQEALAKFPTLQSRVADSLPYNPETREFYRKERGLYMQDSDCTTDSLHAVNEMLLKKERVMFQELLSNEYGKTLHDRYCKPEKYNLWIPEEQFLELVAWLREKQILLGFTGSYHELLDQLDRKHADQNVELFLLRRSYGNQISVPRLPKDRGWRLKQDEGKRNTPQPASTDFDALIASIPLSSYEEQQDAFYHLMGFSDRGGYWTSAIVDEEYQKNTTRQFIKMQNGLYRIERIYQDWDERFNTHARLVRDARD